ncbi:MAG TPA: DUF1501 domain-containing protein [Gemmataceae bacterium]|nr:DUF1501 domain-containing protein [Gemmataceae bacterium]
MLDFITGCSVDCSGSTRRDFLRLGGLAAFGLTLPAALRMRAAAATAATSESRTPPSCILIWCEGGPSHIDTFDPKPDAPPEVRGEFGTIPTALAGVRFSDQLPELAKVADKFSVIRGHDPRNGTHGVADHLMMSGHKFNPSLAYPCYGSVVAKERGYVNGMIPFVQLGRNIDRRSNGGIAGFLGDQYNAFEVFDDPNSPGFRVRDLSLSSQMDRDRLQRRYSMLHELDKYQQRVETDVPAVQARDVFYEKAHDLITSPTAKKAFDLGREPDKVREAYGRNGVGQSCLLARRLVEAGVQFVTIATGGWDTHQNNFTSLKKNLLPPMDRAYAALLRDLSDRGMLDSTLVVWMGDFGRTPKINPSAGRDHWASAGVVCMGGGGIKTGEVVGSTSALGEFVTDSPVAPQDVAATVYHALGVPLHTWFKTADGRPVELCPEGKPVKQLI